MIRTIDRGIYDIASKCVRIAARSGINKRYLLGYAAVVRIVILVGIAVGSSVLEHMVATLAIAACCAVLAWRTVGEERMQKGLGADLDAPGGYAREMNRTGIAALIRSSAMPGILFSEATVVCIVGIIAGGAFYRSGIGTVAAGSILWLAHTVALIMGSYVATVPPVSPSGSRSAASSYGPAETA
jgi:hypothetical protein